MYNRPHGSRAQWAHRAFARLALYLGATATVGAQTPQPTPPPDSTIIRLTLAEARALAARQNPDLLVARQLPEIARGQLRQAQTIRFNPDLSLIGRADPEITLMQEIEWAGQRGIRTTAARRELTRAGFETANVGRLTLADVSIAYYRTLAAAARRQVVDQLAALTDRLMEAVRIQRREGEISLLDANLAEIESGRVRARAASARREVTTAELELKRMLGLGPTAALRLADDTVAVTVDTLRENTLVAAALRVRPDLAEAAAAAAAARAQMSLARREALPNLRIGAVAEPGSSGGGIGVALGISLPVLNRSRGAIAARRAEARQMELRQAATEALVRSDVASAVAALRAANDELRHFQESVLDPARNNAALLGEAYRAGRIPLTSLLLLRNQLLDAEFGFWDAWLTRNEMLVRLEAATGSLTPSSDAGASARTLP